MSPVHGACLWGRQTDDRGCAHLVASREPPGWTGRPVQRGMREVGWLCMGRCNPHLMASEAGAPGPEAREGRCGVEWKALPAEQQGRVSRGSHIRSWTISIWNSLPVQESGLLVGGRVGAAGRDRMLGASQGLGVSLGMLGAAEGFKAGTTWASVPLFWHLVRSRQEMQAGPCHHCLRGCWDPSNAVMRQWVGPRG